jgi:hypothetical protein
MVSVPPSPMATSHGHSREIQVPVGALQTRNSIFCQVIIYRVSLTCSKRLWFSGKIQASHLLLRDGQGIVLEHAWAPGSIPGGRNIVFERAALFNEQRLSIVILNNNKQLQTKLNKFAQ